MREMKFRARWKDTGKTIPDFMNEFTLEALNDECFIVEQFTGLKDKSGREIYEGDIVSNVGKGKRCSCSVICNTGLHYFYQCKCGQRFNRPMVSTDSKNLEVIGNIHENPELLGE